MPIIALIFGIIGILLSLAGIAALTALAPAAIVTGVYGYSGGILAAIFWLASSILLFAAYSGTKARKMSGWNMLFWGEIVSLIGSLITLSIIQGIISALISFYLLYQIKPYFTSNQAISADKDFITLRMEGNYTLISSCGRILTPFSSNQPQIVIFRLNFFLVSQSHVVNLIHLFNNL